MRRFYGFDKCGILHLMGLSSKLSLPPEHYSGQVRTVKFGDTPKLACGVSPVYII